jgi:hypothetical protein
MNSDQVDGSGWLLLAAGIAAVLVVGLVLLRTLSTARPR